MIGRRILAAVLAAVAVAVVAFLLAWSMPASHRAFLPFGPERSCVIAVTDDTDFFEFDNTAPVYALIDSLGLRVTKTVWAFDHEDHPPSRAGLSLEEPQYLAWVMSERERGHEVILHSATAGDDVREITLAAHAMLEELLGEPTRMVIFHSTNLEAFYWGSERLPNPVLRYLYRLRGGRREYLGDDKGSPYYWIDVSRDLVRYVRGYTTNDINTLRLNPSMPYEDSWTPGAPLWCASSNGRLGEEFRTLMAQENVERLKREQGASIVYTHFARGFTESGERGPRVVPELRETLVRCGTDPAVEFAPAGEVLDRLRVAQFLEDAVQNGAHGGEEVVIMLPPELLPVLSDVSVVPERLPAPLNAPALEEGGTVRLDVWLEAVGWELRPGAANVFAAARPLPLRERWRLVLRWLSTSLVSPAYSYESGFLP